MPNTNALIGHTGFVGSNLLAQQEFGAMYNSSNISSIRGRSFSHVICAGATALKWWANKNPAEDRARIQALMDDLQSITAERFTLISTIDVYANPIDVRESDQPAPMALHPYGVNRLALENFIASQFPVHHILRLPGLFGDGLKKNVIYDMMSGNMLDLINPHSSFQWYPLDRLSADIAVIEKLRLQLINIATEPVRTGMIQERFFPGVEIGRQGGAAAQYRMLSEHATLFGGCDAFIMNQAAVLDAMGAFIVRARRRNQ